MSRELSIARIRDEAGVALVYALLAVLILGGLAVLFMARAITETRATGREQRFETAVHVAEGGVDDVIEWTNKNFSYVTMSDGYWLSEDEPEPATAHEYTGDLDASNSELREWAIEIALNDCDLALAPNGVGEACGIRPHQGGTPLPWIFGVGFVPNHDNPSSIRVVKAEIAEGAFSPAKAIVTNGPIAEFTATICGEVRDVHSNQTMHVKGSADTVSPGSSPDKCDDEGSGDVTSTGAYTQEGNPDIGPGSGQTGRVESLPFVSALEVYAILAPDNEEHWYDLCPDGTARRPAFDSDGKPAPCTGTVDPNPGLLGWRTQTTSVPLDGANPVVCHSTSPCWRTGGGGSPLKPGIYYVHHGNAVIEGNLSANAQVTIIASADRELAPRLQTGGSCGNHTTNGRNGSIVTKGTGNTSSTIRPFPGGAPFPGGDPSEGADDLLFLADRDLAMEGNLSGAEFFGVLAAHEQIHAKGSPNIKGALFSEDACDNATNPGSSPNSPVHKNVFTGSVEITYASNLLTPFFDLTHITAWTELR